MEDVHTLRSRFWPSEKPKVPPFMHGWFYDENEKLLSMLIEKHNPTTIVELGSWYGKSAQFIAKSMGKNARLYCLDMWDNQFIKDMWESRGKNYKTEVPFIDKHPLFPTFVVNLWDERHHLTPVVGDTNVGLKLLSHNDVTPDLIYVDADHEYESVAKDLLYIHQTFPNAVVCGDDWYWPEVKRALQDHHSKHLGSSDYTLLIKGNCWHFARNY